MESLGFSTYKIIPSANSDILLLPLHLDDSHSFLLPNCLVKDSDTVLNESGRSGHPCS